MEQNHSTEFSSGVGFVFICQLMLACLEIVGLLLLFPFAVIGLLIVYPVVTFCTVFRTQLVVGIFSRSSAEEYSWFTNQLRSQTFQSFVKEIRPFYISNNNKPEFRNEVQQCNFAILYHTKNRGRINITNVTDSLYDYELNYMFGILGKPNVIVLIDDLDQCSTDEKLRILNDQPDIQTFAHELFLFSSGEKKVITRVSEKMMEIRDVMLEQRAFSNPLGDINILAYLMNMVRWIKNVISNMISAPVTCCQQCLSDSVQTRQYRSSSLSEALLP